MINIVLSASGSVYELFTLSDRDIAQCLDCRGCHKTYACTQKDDMRILYDKLLKADCIVLGSPTYFENVSGLMNKFMDRCVPFYFSKLLKDKKVVLLTSANFSEYVEYDDAGSCTWHDDEIKCAKRCLDIMDNFSELLGLDVIGSSYSLHGNCDDKKDELNKIGQVIKSSSS